MLLLLLACVAEQPPSTPDEVQPVAWSRTLPRLEGGRQRVITHLHSPWSHDACDGDPQPDGVPNEPCLADLRAGLCAAGIDTAFLTDHPTHAASVDFDELFLQREDDERNGAVNVIACDDGTEVAWAPGIEDELMPLGLDSWVPGTADERDALLNRSDVEALEAMSDAGAAVFVAHTESRDLVLLSEQQDAGLSGIEIFNLHAMFAPDIRPEYLGLDAWGWVSDIEPFTAPEATGEPDLFVLGVLGHQRPSLDTFDALLARGPVTGIVGTDAHQNVMPLDLRDGERADSYRRMLRWMSNHVYAEPGAEAAEQALRDGRSMVVFEVLGTPQGLIFEAGGVPMGGEAPSGSTLTVTCPTLHPASPTNTEAPEITVRVLKDGEVWRESCGEFEAEDGVYRVEFDLTPYHLRDLLGETPEDWLRPFPWIYTNAIRVGG